MVHSICRLLCILVCKIFCRLKAYGRQHLPRKGGFIIASNHVSNLDPVILGASSPRKLNYLAKEELFSGPFFRWLLFQCGAFPVKRDIVDLSALKEAMRRVRGGGVLALFPEGTRQDSNKPQEPYPGVGFLAAKLGVPVIPAYIKGSNYALPKGAKFIRPYRVCVYFGQEISLERRQPYQDIAREIMHSIRHLAHVDYQK